MMETYDEDMETTVHLQHDDTFDDESNYFDTKKELFEAAAKIDPEPDVMKEFDKLTEAMYCGMGFRDKMRENPEVMRLVLELNKLIV